MFISVSTHRVFGEAVTRSTRVLHVLHGSGTRLCLIRDRSLIEGKGGGPTKREAGANEVVPLQKLWEVEYLAMLKGGGHITFWGSFNMGA